MVEKEEQVDFQVFTDAVKDEIDRFKAEFKEYLKSGIFLIDQVNRFMVRGQGKTIRPMLVFLTAKLVGDTDERTIRAALIVELLHNATLVHDDVVDDSNKRRGLPSVKKIWNNKVAVLYGDYLLAHSLMAMLDLRDFDVFDILSTTARRLAKGELLQAAKTRKLDITEDVYLRMIADKTAALMSASAELGGLTAGGNGAAREALKSYGENLGMAFQIRDDMLDFTGREGLLGKPVGGDIKEKKITLPLIHALQNADDAERKSVLRAVRKRRSKDVISYVRESPGLEYAAKKASDYIGKAKQSLNYFPFSNERELLIKLTDFAVRRNR